MIEFYTASILFCTFLEEGSCGKTFIKEHLVRPRLHAKPNNTLFDLIYIESHSKWKDFHWVAYKVLTCEDILGFDVLFYRPTCSVSAFSL